MNGNTKKIWTVCLVLGTSLSGCGPLNGGTRDVPCLQPDAWVAEERGQILTRPEAEGSDVLLLTHQNREQRDQDEEDDVIGNGPHGLVYRFDPSTESFELVDDEVWDDSNGMVTEAGGLARTTAFARPERDQLTFEGTPVLVAGGGEVLTIHGAPHSPAVAVESTTGISMGRFFASGSTGQHYHQLFSEIDGQPLGDAVRIATGGIRTYVDVRWTRDERYVIYYQEYGSRFDLVCVVHVADEMALLDEERASDVPCLQPSAWPDRLQYLYTRPDTDGSEVLLLTHQTYEQHLEYRIDRYTGTGPHGPVYRFDPSTESFALVDDEVWEEADSVVTIGGGREIAFIPTEDDGITFEGEPVDVEGGTVVLAAGAPDSPAVAVLSTDGISFFRPYNTSFTGQYYHQLFSEIDGRPLGEAVRVAVGGRDVRSPRIRWTEDERYVLYYQDAGRLGNDLVCVVRVDDELALLEKD